MRGPVQVSLEINFVFSSMDNRTNLRQPRQVKDLHTKRERKSPCEYIPVVYVHEQLASRTFFRPAKQREHVDDRKNGGEVSREA